MLNFFRPTHILASTLPRACSEFYLFKSSWAVSFSWNSMLTQSGSSATTALSMELSVSIIIIFLSHNTWHAYFHSKYRASHWFLAGDWALVKIQCLPLEIESLVQDSVIGPNSSSNSWVVKPSSFASLRSTSPLATYIPSLTWPSFCWSSTCKCCTQLNHWFCSSITH